MRLDIQLKRVSPEFHELVKNTAMKQGIPMGRYVSRIAGLYERPIKQKRTYTKAEKKHFHFGSFRDVTKIKEISDYIGVTVEDYIKVALFLELSDIKKGT